MTTGINALHGFTQTGASWAETSAALTARLNSLVFTAPDMPGHGARSSTPMTIPDAADVLAEELPLGIWMGYSMGGRHLLNLAIRHPHRCIGLVLISTTAGLDSPTDRAARRQSDERTAQRILEVGVDAFLDEWISQPMFAGRVQDLTELEGRRRNTAEGLAGSLRLAGTGAQDPLWDRLSEITVPTLIITGADDHKFTAIGQRLLAEIPNAKHHVISGVSHAVHLERPEEFADLVTEWITQRGQDLR